MNYGTTTPENFVPFIKSSNHKAGSDMGFFSTERIINQIEIH